MNQPPAPPPTPHAARLVAIAERLNGLAALPVTRDLQCPGCSTEKLVQVTGAATGKCPLCSKAELHRRDLDPDRCPVCRAGRLAPFTVADNTCFCPVCRLAVLEVEPRKRIGGLVVDDWLVCRLCLAEFDAQGGARAKLVSYSDDAYKIGERYRGKTHPLAEWQRISQRSPHYLQCQSCVAQLDAWDDGRATLAFLYDDPFGIGAAYRGKTMPRAHWAKLAAGLDLDDGNLLCPQCEANFDYDPGAKTLCLVQGPKVGDVADGWRNRPLPVPNWYFAAAGKQSPQPGWLCPGCHTEFDTEHQQLVLIKSTAPVLQGHVREKYSLNDWNRLARGLPLEAEEARLRAEAGQMQQEHARLAATAAQQEEARRQALEVEFVTLLKQAVLDGHLPHSLAPLLPLDTDEAICWQSTVDLYQMRTVQGTSFWELSGPGTVVVSQNFFHYQPARGSVQSLPLHTLGNVRVEYPGGRVLAILNFTDKGAGLLAFLVHEMVTDVSFDNQRRRLVLLPQDFIAMLQRLAAG